MSVSKTKNTKHCDLCSFDAIDDVLCPSCREMITRLSLVAARMAEQELPQKSAKASAKTAGYPVIGGEDINGNTDATTPYNWRR